MSMKISRKELKDIIKEEMHKSKEEKKSKMIGGKLYPLPLRLLYRMFGLDEELDFRASYKDRVKELLTKRKEDRISDNEEQELLDLLQRPELMEGSNNEDQ